VLITSRSPRWGALSGRLEVNVLARAETIALLRARIPALSEELAAELGDLPLAAAQAVGYLEQTALPPVDYLRRFRAHRAGLLTRGNVIGYFARLDTAWALSLERLRCRPLRAPSLRLSGSTDAAGTAPSHPVSIAAPRPVSAGRRPDVGVVPEDVVRVVDRLDLR
jgi:hypothetical protein